MIVPTWVVVAEVHLAVVMTAPKEGTQEAAPLLPCAMTAEEEITRQEDLPQDALLPVVGTTRDRGRLKIVVLAADQDQELLPACTDHFFVVVSVWLIKPSE